MGESRFSFALEFGDNLLRQHLAQFDTPLVDGVDVPDDALGEDSVLVERHELAERNMAGVSCSVRMVFDGRLPSNTRCGTSQSGVPSAWTSSGVLPKASASAWAKTFARRMSWCQPRGLSVLTKAMKSHGMRRVP